MERVHGAAQGRRCWRLAVALLLRAHCRRRAAPGLQVLTLKTDHRYWPTWELRLDKRTGEWVRRAISSPI